MTFENQRVLRKSGIETSAIVALTVFTALSVGLPALAAYTPNDDQWGQQTWASGANGIQLNKGWDQAGDGGQADSLGSDSVLVADLESGFRPHPDLNGMWFVNDREIAGNSIDDDDFDGNPATFIDDTSGWDFVGNDNNPFYVDATDAGTSNGFHGTAVAGVIGAIINNEPSPATPGTDDSYIAGSAKVKILPIRVSSPGDYASGVAYAVAMGADVITTSHGGWGWTNAEINAAQAQVDIAYAHGVVLVAAAGEPFPAHPNCANDIPFPARLDHVIAVGGLTAAGGHPANYCTGIQMGIVAPSEDVMTLSWQVDALHPEPGIPTDADWSGTSFSAPMVAGAAALIRSYRPDFTNDQVIHAIYGTAQDISPPDGWATDITFGHGLLQVDDALKAAQRIRNQVWGGYDFNRSPGVVSADTKPAIDVDPWGYSHTVDIETPAGGVQQVYFTVYDQAGRNYFGPLSQETNTVFQATASLYPDITVDAMGYSHIAWIDGNDIVYTRLNPGNGVDLAPTAISTQLNGLAGAPGFLNIMVGTGTFDPQVNPPNIYFVYNQNVGGGNLHDVILSAVDWATAHVLPFPSNLPIAIATGAEDQVRPSADIAPRSIANQCNGQSDCIYVVYDSHSLAPNGGWTIYWQLVDPSRGAVFGAVALDGPGQNNVVESASIDVDPVSRASAVAWSNFDILTNSRSVMFSRVRSDRTVATNYPELIGTTRGGGKDPSVSVTPAGFAGVVWSQGTVNYVEVGPNGEQTTWSPGGDAEIEAGAGLGGANQAYPQIASSKSSSLSEAATFDRSDGNYRFFWYGQDPVTLKITVRFSSTRPVMTDMTFVAGASPVHYSPDVVHDSNGGTHAVFQEFVGGFYRVTYTYWSPTTIPTANNWAFQDTASRVGVDGQTPKVEVASYAVPYGSPVINAFVFYLDGAAGLVGNRVYLTIYKSQVGPPPMFKFAAAAPFAGDNPNPNAMIERLDSSIFADRSGTFTNGKTVLSAVWRETTPAGVRDIMYGAADETNAQLQAERSLVNSPANLLEYPSIQNGPGDRVYLAYTLFAAGTWSVYLNRYTLPIAPNPVSCWHTQLGGPQQAYRAVIGVDIEPDRATEDPVSSTIQVSDSRIHAAVSVQTPSGRFDVRYEGVQDNADIGCSNGGGGAVVVPPRSVAPSAPPNEDYGSTAAIWDLSMFRTHENRLIVAFSGKRDISQSHQYSWGEFQIELAGLTNSGGIDYFSDMPITHTGGWDGLAPAVSLSPGGTLLVMYEAGVPNGNPNAFSVEYQEARRI